MMVSAAQAREDIRKRKRDRRRRKLQLFGKLLRRPPEPKSKFDKDIDSDSENAAGTGAGAGAGDSSKMPPTRPPLAPSPVDGADPRRSRHLLIVGDAGKYRLSVAWKMGIPLERLRTQAQRMLDQDELGSHRAPPPFPSTIFTTSADVQVLGTDLSAAGEDDMTVMPAQESMQHHVHPVVYMGSVDARTVWRDNKLKPSTGLVTADASGMVSLWNLERSYSKTYGWHQPRHSFLVDPTVRSVLFLCLRVATRFSHFSPSFLFWRKQLPVLAPLPGSAPELLFPAHGTSVPSSPDTHQAFVSLVRGPVECQCV